jgi:hypothetical protein
VEFVVVLIVTPVVVWLLDRFLFRGDLTGTIAETVASVRNARRQSCRTGANQRLG